jgi:hypothetical protein
MCQFYSTFEKLPGSCFVGSKDIKLEEPLFEKPYHSKYRSNKQSKVNPEFYLGKITDFYEQLITILYSTIAGLLVISFLYLFVRSKREAEETAREAIDGKSFNILLKDKIDKQFSQTLKERDFVKIEEIEERIAWLEEQINIKSYDEINDEEPDGVS